MRIVDEEAEDEPGGARCARREQSLPTFLPQHLADLLVARPGPVARHEGRQTDVGQALAIAQVGDARRRDAKAPEVAGTLLAGELAERRNTPLGKMAIPLGPERLFVSG